MLVGSVAGTFVPRAATTGASPPGAADRTAPDYAFPDSLELPWPCGPDTLVVVRDWREHVTAGFALDFGLTAPDPAVDVLAPAAGTVVAKGWSDEGYGEHVEIATGGGWHVVLGHLERYAPGVVIGRHVAAGEAVGTLGNSGLEGEPPHLHFELLTASGRAPEIERIVRVFHRDVAALERQDPPQPVPHPCPSP
jgi:hypothetical protein